MKRPTEMLKAVHDEAVKAHPMRWVIGLLAMVWVAYRIERHAGHAAGESARVEHIITACIAAFVVAYLPYAREGVVALLRGVAPYLPFVRKNGGDPNSTLSGGASRPREKP